MQYTDNFPLHSLNGNTFFFTCRSLAGMLWLYRPLQCSGLCSGLCSWTGCDVPIHPFLCGCFLRLLLRPAWIFIRWTGRVLPVAWRCGVSRLIWEWRRNWRPVAALWWRWGGRVRHLRRGLMLIGLAWVVVLRYGLYRKVRGRVFGEDVRSRTPFWKNRASEMMLGIYLIVWLWIKLNWIKILFF